MPADPRARTRPRPGRAFAALAVLALPLLLGGCVSGYMTGKSRKDLPAQVTAVSIRQIKPSYPLQTDTPEDNPSPEDLQTLRVATEAIGPMFQAAGIQVVPAESGQQQLELEVFVAYQPEYVLVPRGVTVHVNIHDRSGVRVAQVVRAVSSRTTLGSHVTLYVSSDPAVLTRIAVRDAIGELKSELNKDRATAQPAVYTRPGNT